MDAPAASPKTPNVRLVLLSTVAGAMEPCGCRKDMLGGVDHAAALLQSKQTEAPHQLVLAAGPMLFLDPELEATRRDQDLWKAESIASSLTELGVRAWAPGVNDFAAGPEQLQRLLASSSAKLLAANLESEKVPLADTFVTEVGSYRVGVTGIGAAPAGDAKNVDATQALRSAAQKLRKQNAQILVALLAAPRGEALRMAEQVPDFDVIAVGRPINRGEENDNGAPPTLVHGTLVIEAPNHLQSMAFVDLFVQGEDFSFDDSVGIERAERKASLERRISELEKRLEVWRAQTKPSARAVAERQAQVERLKQQLEALGQAASDVKGSSFSFEVTEVREKAGSHPQVAKRMQAYYRRVNEHNRIAFKDRKPKPPQPGKAHYVGQSECADCHGEAEEFWKGTGHAKAYLTLTQDFKEFNLDCVGCHVTGYEQPGGSTVTFVEGLKDVQCEACHGPGSKHVDDSEKKGLIVLSPTESVCRTCHHPPHVADDWSFELSWNKIVGPGHGEKARRPVAEKPPASVKHGESKH